MPRMEMMNDNCGVHCFHGCGPLAANGLDRLKAISQGLSSRMLRAVAYSKRRHSAMGCLYNVQTCEQLTYRVAGIRRIRRLILRHFVNGTLRAAKAVAFKDLFVSTTHRSDGFEGTAGGHPTGGGIGTNRRTSRHRCNWSD